jgi:hypothetical protein
MYDNMVANRNLVNDKDDLFRNKVLSEIDSELNSLVENVSVCSSLDTLNMVSAKIDTLIKLKSKVSGLISKISGLEE